MTQKNILAPYLILIILVGCITGCAPTEAQKNKDVAENMKAILSMKMIFVNNSSGPSEIALAKHLKQSGAKLYGLYTCVHCYDQLYLFGKEAVRELDRTECEPSANNYNSELCQDLKTKGYPTWIIDNQRYTGMQSLEFLARKSNYRGPSDFKNSSPQHLE
jgi:hypothetical protein